MSKKERADWDDIKKDEPKEAPQTKGGKFTGEGVTYYDKGKKKIRYSGFWKDGKYHGKGKFFYQNGMIKFDGTCENGFFKEGKYYYLEKELFGLKTNHYLIYDGELQKNIFHGRGILYSEEGKVVHKGYFSKGKFTGILSNDIKEFMKSPIDNKKKFKKTIKMYKESDFGERVKIGFGVCGEVFKAKRLSDGKEFAIKIFNNNFIFKDFENEFKIYHSFPSHPNIMEIHGIIKFKGTVALVMDLASIALKPKIKQKKFSGDFNEKVKILRGVANGLNVLHKQNIIHRCIYPNNVVIMPDGEARIIDFCFSKLIDPKPRKYSLLVGNGFHISPEVTGVNLKRPEDAFYTTKADIYSFGILIHEVLFETINPYDGHVVDYRIGDRSIAKHKLRPIIDKDMETDETRWLIALAKKCWQIKPEKRPTAAEIVEMFKQKKAGKTLSIEIEENNAESDEEDEDEEEEKEQPKLEEPKKEEGDDESDSSSDEE